MITYTDSGKLRVDRAIVVEGRDDIDAVSRACDALIIATHGAGIAQETWDIIGKAYREIGIVIMTDPDHAGEEIRRRITARFPDALQCRLAREDAVCGDDIGIENASAESIQAALIRSYELHDARTRAGKESGDGDADLREVCAADLIELGLSAADGAKELRAAVCRRLGIGYCNSRALVSRLRGFRIGYDELRTAVLEISKDR
ncbi:MAG: DUF4093 domain-containing protein [Mogibacterium sp.]|nr:DUF4093 domain-containing protein [Mogibacterium sp.]